MNRGLLLKAWRETWVGTTLVALGVFGFEWILARVLPGFQEDLFGALARTPFFQNLLGGLLGSRLGETVGPAAFTAIPWVHPVMLALLWAHEILLTTRMPAGEIDRGTVDVVLALPVSRRRIWLTESFLWITTGLALVVVAVLGGVLGGRSVPVETRIDPSLLIPIGVNLFCLYLAVGGFGAFVSSLSDRRGRAAGLIFGVVLFSFFLNFLANYWAPAERLSFLGLLHYYRPLGILDGGPWPILDLSVLVAVGAGFWAAGGVIFSRRDIRTL